MYNFHNYLHILKLLLFLNNPMSQTLSEGNDRSSAFLCQLSTAATPRRVIASSIGTELRNGCDRHRLTPRQQEISRLLLPGDKSVVSTEPDTDSHERAGGEVRPRLPESSRLELRQTRSSGRSGAFEGIELRVWRS